MADLAACMGSVAEKRSEFELLAPVVFNCVCFRLRHLDDEGNRVVLRQLVKSGFAFLGPRFGQRALRYARLLHEPAPLRTEDIELIMNELVRLAGSD